MNDRALLKNKNIHFVGIGGIGMSGIARVLLEMGYNISGSDVELNGITGKLEKMGARICRGHSASSLPRSAQAVVYSSSISGDNPEMAEARRRRIRIVHRAHMLGELFNARKGIAVTGTHGKTTTSSIISVMLENIGCDPTVIIGGEIANLDGNAKLGKGAHIVAEADESDSSFMHLKPFYTVITNVEMEHLDHFRTLGRIKAAYRAFIGNTKKGGTLFYNIDDPILKGIACAYKGNKRSFGYSKNAYAYPLNIKMNGFNTSFDCVCGKKVLGRVSLSIPGAHNVLNAIAAILVGLEMGLGFDKIVGAIKDFAGAKRRFELRAHAGGVMLIEDYAHHPTEIRTVLAASRNWPNKRVIAVFQPHRYSRTKFFASDFGRSFKGVDKLILTDIYAASEKPIKGVSVKCVYDAARRSGLRDVEMLKKEEIAGRLARIKKPGDMIIIMGAGNIKKVADELCGKLLKENRRFDADMVRRLKGLVRGRLITGERLAAHTSFKIGGRADIWFEPKDANDLKRAVCFAAGKNMPFFIIGNGSNILASDSGFGGMMIHLASPYFKKLVFSGNSVCVGAGFSLPRLVAASCSRGLAGLESLVGIPGMVGGAVYMNAGGWTNPIFRNIGEVVASLKVMDYNGRIKRLNKSDLNFNYRNSNLERYIILEARLKLKPGDKNALVSSLSHFLKMKREKQVLDIPSAGCIFKNPSDFQFTCGQMIDMLGLKGRRVGGAEVSTRHANFIVNRRGATCRDVLELVELVKDRVKASYNIDLEMEVKVV
ncbi:MAG: UDP-N-acetylmuramate--L-alanine ligase [Candidatus Omnitrophota bacterium]